MDKLDLCGSPFPFLLAKNLLLLFGRFLLTDSDSKSMSPSPANLQSFLHPLSLYTAAKLPNIMATSDETRDTNEHAHKVIDVNRMTLK